MRAEPVVIVAFALLVLLVLGWVIADASKRRSVVSSHSSALLDLQQLNEEYKQKINYWGRLRYDWVDVVNSKSKLDRYDLDRFFHAQIALLEGQVAYEIERRLQALGVHRDYQKQYERVSSAKLGKSSAPGWDPEKFERLEAKLFGKRKLAEPPCEAQVTCTVRYSSPQGKNSYAKQQQWDFNGLWRGLDQMRRVREQQSTAQFLRKQERQRMTPGMRFQVLKRDGQRCQQCGASALTHGVSLHVDHILPVSKGGRTVMENLQALCETCNLGKSNRH